MKSFKYPVRLAHVAKRIINFYVYALKFCQSVSKMARISSADFFLSFVYALKVSFRNPARLAHLSYMAIIRHEVQHLLNIL